MVTLSKIKVLNQYCNIIKMLNIMKIESNSDIFHQLIIGYLYKTRHMGFVEEEESSLRIITEFVKNIF
jgi:hypothetical protein